MPALNNGISNLRINGNQVQLSGQGQPVVFVHGVGSHKESWDETIAALGAGFQCLRYDLRGHGESEKTPAPYSLDMFCDDLDDIVREIGWSRFDLVGFSLGGLIGQAYALRSPNAVRTLSIISSVSGRTPQEQERVLKRAQDLATGGANTHLETAVERWFTDAFRRDHPEVIQARAARSRANDPACYAAAYQVLAEGDLADALHRISCPALIATGEEDSGSTPRMARLMADRIPDSRLHIWPELRHSVLLEAPQRVAGLLRPFLLNPGQ